MFSNDRNEMASANPYDDLVMDHIKNARNYRVLNDVNRKATGTNPLCGDEITVFLKVEGDALAEIAFQCTCCGITMASASIMTEQVRGKPTHDVTDLVQAVSGILSCARGRSSKFSSPAVEAILETVKRYPARMRCAALPWFTLDDILKSSAAGASGLRG